MKSSFSGRRRRRRAAGRRRRPPPPPPEPPPTRRARPRAPSRARRVHEAHVLQEILHLLPGHFHSCISFRRLASLVRRCVRRARCQGRSAGLLRRSVAAPPARFAERVDQARELRGRFVEGAQELGRRRLQQRRGAAPARTSRGGSSASAFTSAGGRTWPSSSAPLISSFGSSSASLIGDLRHRDRVA